MEKDQRSISRDLAKKVQEQSEQFAQIEEDRLRIAEHLHDSGIISGEKLIENEALAEKSLRAAERARQAAQRALETLGPSADESKPDSNKH